MASLPSSDELLAGAVCGSAIDDVGPEIDVKMVDEITSNCVSDGDTCDGLVGEVRSCDRGHADFQRELEGLSHPELTTYGR